MKRSKFTEEQILYALRQVEAGIPPADVCRQLGCSESELLHLEKRYGNLGLTEVKELRQLRDESTRLKRLVADLTLDNTSWRRWCERSSEPDATARARPLDTGAVQIAVIRSCRLAGLSRAAWYKRSVAKDQSALRMRIVTFVTVLGYSSRPALLNQVRRAKP
jgi:putative transposase